MQADTAYPVGDPDTQQVENLCADLGARVDTAHTEQVLLGQLIETTATTRPFRSHYYRVLLDQARDRYRRLYELLLRFCR